MSGSGGGDGRSPTVAARRFPAADPVTGYGQDAVTWGVLVGLGLALTAVAVRLHARLGTASAPFIGEYRIKVEVGSLLAPAVAVAVLTAVRAGVHERLRWRWLLAGGYVAALAWALALAFVDGGNGLASPVANPQEYLRDVPVVGTDPVAFLHGFTARTGDYAVATRQHPPGPVLLLWAVGHLGLTRPEALGLAITMIGCLSVPLIAVATGSLCGPATARRLLPVLALAPYAVWLAVSMDAITLTLCAAFVACGVLGSEPRRTPWWAAASGLVLGVAALFSYAVAWLAVSVILIYFVRRRPLLFPITGAAALVPLGLARAAGFVWPDGLTAAQADFSIRVGPHRSWLLWTLLDVLILLIASGPAIVAAARKVRRTPAWPFLAGAGLGVVFALGSGLARGEVERSWLPFFPWLLAAAVAPERDPGSVGSGRPDGAPTPVVLVGVGAAGAILVEAVLRTAW